MSGGIGGNPDIKAPDLVDPSCETNVPGYVDCCPITGLLASRPAANTQPAGKIFFATDTVESFITDGVVWYRIAADFASFENVAALPATLSGAASTFLIEIGGGVVTLPSGAPTGRKVHIKDLNGNALAAPIVVQAPVGETIDQGSSVSLNSDYSLITFVKVNTSNWIAA